MKRMEKRMLNFVVVTLILSANVVFATTTYTNEAAFLANSGIVSLESFEGVPANNNPTAFNFLALTDFTFSSTDSFGVYDSPAAWAGHATDGRNYINSINSGMVFSFNYEINSFGLNIIDWGDHDIGVLTFSNNVGDNYQVAVTPLAGDNEIFFGVINGDLSFNTVTFTNTVVGGSHSIDEVYYSVVPEPATMVLLGLGGLMLRRKT